MSKRFLVGIGSGTDQKRIMDEKIMIKTLWDTSDKIIIYNAVVTVSLSNPWIENKISLVAWL